MELLMLIVFLGLVALVSIPVDRRWQGYALARRPAQPTATPTPLAATNGQSLSLLEQIKAGWRKRMGWRTQADADPPKLRAWLTAHLAD
jgi:hypothetical protein